MLAPALAERLLHAVDDGFDEQLRVTADLVRCPSVRGAEASAQDLMARELAARGYAVERWTIDPEELRPARGFSPVDGRRLHERAVGRRHAAGERSERALADRQRPRRRRAGRPARDVDLAAVRARDPRRLALRPRRRRHEVRPDRGAVRPRGLAPHGPGAGRRRPDPFGDRGGVHRQRCLVLRPARLPGGCGADPGADRPRAALRPGRRDVVSIAPCRPSGPCRGGRYRLERDPRRLSPDRGVAGAGGALERAARRRPALPDRAAADQLQRRQDRRRRLGVERARLVPARLPDLAPAGAGAGGGARGDRGLRRRRRPGTIRSSPYRRPRWSGTAFRPSPSCRRRAAPPRRA